MRVTIPDDLADTYAAYATAQGVDLDNVITRQLERFRHLEPGKTAIVIRADALTDLQNLLGGTPIRNGQDLIDRVRRHGQLTFESYNLELSHGQKAELEYRSVRAGKSVKQLVEEIWRDLQGNFFWNSGGGEAKAPARKAG